MASLERVAAMCSCAAIVEDAREVFHTTAPIGTIAASTAPSTICGFHNNGFILKFIFTAGLHAPSSVHAARFLRAATVDNNRNHSSAELCVKRHKFPHAFHCVTSPKWAPTPSGSTDKISRSLARPGDLRKHSLIQVGTRGLNSGSRNNLRNSSAKWIQQTRDCEHW